MVEKYEVTVDPNVLAKDAMAEIRRNTFGAGRIFSDPSRKELSGGVFDAMTIGPSIPAEAPTRSWGRLSYRFRANPGIVVFGNAFTKGRDPLSLTLLHELAHVQQIIDQPAAAAFDSEYSAEHQHAIHEIDAYRLVYHTMRHAYISSSPRWSGNESLKQLPAARDGFYLEIITKGLPVDRISASTLDDIAERF